MCWKVIFFWSGMFAIQNCVQTKTVSARNGGSLLLLVYNKRFKTVSYEKNNLLRFIMSRLRVTLLYSGRFLNSSSIGISYGTNSNRARSLRVTIALHIVMSPTALPSCDIILYVLYCAWWRCASQPAVLRRRWWCKKKKKK